MNSFYKFLVFNYSLHSLLFGISLRCVFLALLTREETESERVEVICPRLCGEAGSPAAHCFRPFPLEWCGNGKQSSDAFSKQSQG